MTKILEWSLNYLFNDNKTLKLEMQGGHVVISIIANDIVFRCWIRWSASLFASNFHQDHRAGYGNASIDRILRLPGYFEMCSDGMYIDFIPTESQWDEITRYIAEGAQCVEYSEPNDYMAPVSLKMACKYWGIETKCSCGSRISAHAYKPYECVHRRPPCSGDFCTSGSVVLGKGHIPPLRKDEETLTCHY